MRNVFNRLRYLTTCFLVGGAVDREVLELWYYKQLKKTNTLIDTNNKSIKLLLHTRHILSLFVVGVGLLWLRIQTEFCTLRSGCPKMSEFSLTPGFCYVNLDPQVNWSIKSKSLWLSSRERKAGLLGTEKETLGRRKRKVLQQETQEEMDTTSGLEIIASHMAG